MAEIIKINPQNVNGGRVLAALQQIRAGFATLVELDGLRRNAIGAGAKEMQEVFGLFTEGDAQTLSDRVEVVLAMYGNPQESKLREIHDLVDGVTNG